MSASHQSVRRLWNKSAAARREARRPWKTLVFSMVGQVQKGHGWLFSRSASEAQLQAWLVRLWTDGRERQAFLDDPETWMVDRRISDVVADKLSQLDHGQLTRFAESLVGKRLGQTRHVLPRTRARLGEDFSVRFISWARDHSPRSTHTASDDAHGFGTQLLTQNLEPEVRDILRWELLHLGLGRRGWRLGMTWFAHDVRGTGEGPFPRRMVVATWYRGMGRSHARLWCWAMGRRRS